MEVNETVDRGDRHNFICQNCNTLLTFESIDQVSIPSIPFSQQNASGSTKVPDDNSFVDLGQATSMMGSFIDIKQKQPTSSRGGKASSFQTLTRIFELATTATHVDHPLCVNCVSHLVKDIEAQRIAREQLAAAYRSALCVLEGEASAASGGWQGSEGYAYGHTLPQTTLLSDEDLQAELKHAESEERVEIERAARLQAEYAVAQEDLAKLDLQAQDLAQRESDYWRQFNALWLELHSATEDCEAVCAKRDVAARHLEGLRHTNILEEAFHIWFDGPYGTISGFRMGRHNQDVSWEELNSAWGQAVLLLHMMTRMYEDYRWAGGNLKPMASRPIISDGRSDYPLFGPASRMWGGGYDKAMALFIACMDDFAQYAKAKDERLKRTPFRLPNAIDVERATVRGLTIKFVQNALINNHTKWNTALKYMLVNLKFLLHWVMKDQSISDQRQGFGSLAWMRDALPDIASSMVGPRARGSEGGSMFDGARSMCHVGGR